MGLKPCLCKILLKLQTKTKWKIIIYTTNSQGLQQIIKYRSEPKTEMQQQQQQKKNDIKKKRKEKSNPLQHQLVHFHVRETERKQP